MRRQDREPLMPFGLYLVATVYLQAVRGMSALTTGLAMISAPIAGRLTDRSGGRLVLVGVILQGRLGAAHLTATTGDTALVEAIYAALLVSVALTAVAALLSLAVTRR